MLRARELPAMGGDTLWCDPPAAYKGLSDEVKALIEGRTAMAAEFPPQHHTIVRTHPETGDRVLFVNASFTSRIDDMDEEASGALLRYLLDRFKTPEYQARFPRR